MSGNPVGEFADSHGRAGQIEDLGRLVQVQACFHGTEKVVEEQQATTRGGIGQLHDPVLDGGQIHSVEDELRPQVRRPAADSAQAQTDDVLEEGTSDKVEAEFGNIVGVPVGENQVFF